MALVMTKEEYHSEVNVPSPTVPDENDYLNHWHEMAECAMPRGPGRSRRLPPLLSVQLAPPTDNSAEMTSPSDTSPRSSSSSRGFRIPASSSSGSRYHRNCCVPSGSSPTSSGNSTNTSSYTSYHHFHLEVSAKHATGQSRSTKGGVVNGMSGPHTVAMVRSCSNECIGHTVLNPQLVTEYLKENQDFLESYVMTNVDLELIERWVIRKSKQAHKRAQSAELDSAGKPGRKTSLSRWKFCVHADKRKMLQNLTSSLYFRPNKAHVLSELASTIASAVNAELWNLFLYNKNTQETYALEREESGPRMKPLHFEMAGTIAAFVAANREPIRAKIEEYDERFPSGTPMAPKEAAYVLGYPILQPDGELTGVLELYRKENESSFHEEDEEIVNSYLVWGGIALHYAELYTNMARQRKLNNFLLTVVKSIFQDMVSMDAVIVKIMTFAQKLVNADRASLFLVDGRTKELYARIFDVSGEPDGGSCANLEVAKEIRFPIGTGIAGYVALTGEALNIPSAYNDERFNRSIDQQTGYTTRNLLCMPIFIRGNVIGVVQMVNKSSGPFTKQDEEAFATFATYCGLALHHARLYDKIRRSEQKYKVAMEVLSYHNTCTEEEVQTIKNAPPPINTENYVDFSFSPYALSSDEKVMASIFMFVDLFGLQKFSLDCLIRFTLTVRKNYRRVPYHNWAHGFSVANSMYAIIKHSRGVFRPLEELCLFVSCLCHDLDHRGKTNQFLVNSASPLAAMYTTSTLEHHHFNQTVSILQQEGHNIFKNLSSEEYKQVLGNIKHCILATDLAVFFPNKVKMRTILDEGNFDPDNNEHRLLMEAISMTACDLCASTKPWDQQKETVRVIFEEFYDQGDAERAQGREPIPMMDRNKHHEQPASQVGFLKGICIPCYEILEQLIPQTKPMLEGCLANLERWEKLAEEQKQIHQQQSDSTDMAENDECPEPEVCVEQLDANEEQQVNEEIEDAHNEEGESKEEES